MELKFSWSISEIKIEVHAKFCEVTMSGSYISKTTFSQIMVCKLQMTLCMKKGERWLILSSKKNNHSPFPKIYLYLLVHYQLLIQHFVGPLERSFWQKLSFFTRLTTVLPLVWHPLNTLKEGSEPVIPIKKWKIWKRSRVCL